MRENKEVTINNLNDEQKINYIKNLLFNNDLTQALSLLLKDEKKDLEITKIVIETLGEELFINHIKKISGKINDHDSKFYVYSRIISILSFYNKTVVLSALLKSLSKEQLKDVAFYEYQNKTDISFSNKIFNKYCSCYKEEALKLIKPTSEEVLMLTMEMEKYNSLTKEKQKGKRSAFVIVALIILIIVMAVGFGYKYHKDSELLNKYEGLIYPGIYLNNVELSGTKIAHLETLIKKEKERISAGTLTVTGVNGDYKFTYKDMGISIDDDGLLSEIQDYNDKLPRFKKISFIKHKDRYKTFNIKGYFNTSSIDDFMKKLEETINTTPKNDGIVIDAEHNVSYDKGTNGFTLDVNKTRENILSVLSVIKEESVITAEGSVVQNQVNSAHLSVINKKTSSYTTYFTNAGNRGHNITLAASKLNGTVLMPGDTFSYLSVVGPYGKTNGYLPAPIYLNSELATANGGGVCQLASTLYMAQLKSGLETLYRTNHTFAPAYVPKGLDATVYSTTVDYKFKNQYNYPVYISSYVKGNYLTVDIWTNGQASGEKTYEPYAVYSNGAYLSYLKEIQDGKVISEKYLSRSVYKTH